MFKINQIREVELNNITYCSCRDIILYIGMTVGQYERETRRLKSDKLLSQYVIKTKLKSNGGVQDTLCVCKKVIPMWICRINVNLLEDKHIEKINSLCIDTIAIPYDYVSCDEEIIYNAESKLRDEIFSIGSFEDIKITNKEVTYEFGRIDLFGIDIDGFKCCIELKKQSHFGDTKDQLIKYKASCEFDRVIYCAYEVDVDFFNWCKLNNIECYTYKRKLVLHKEF